MKNISIFLFVILLSLGACTKSGNPLDPDPNLPDTQRVAAPLFNPPGGTYSYAQKVSISCATDDVIIRYTTDESEPTETSAQYTSPITVSSTTILKAKAFRSGWNPSPVTRATYLINEMIYVPAGTFTMGRTKGSGFNDELPTHSVTLNSFYIGKNLVTQAEYVRYMPPPVGWVNDLGLGDDYPAYYVTWYAALKYCNLRSMAEGLTPVYSINGSTNPANWGRLPRSDNPTWNAAICNWSANGYRLPTEAEWEYAARAATNTPDYLYSGSDDVDDVAWYDGNNSPNGTKPVGGKAPNALGIYDMSGNLFEWCWDWYDVYSSNPQNSPTGPPSGTSRIARGGCWYCDALRCRVALRYHYLPTFLSCSTGFRVCRSAL